MIVNVRGFFIGMELQGPGNEDALKLGLLQVAAKTQLLIVSSLAAVIFHVLRAELMFGDGLPLGLIVSGWSFTQLSYFWSAEFWGGVLSKEIIWSWKQWKGCGRRLFFIGLVLVSGTLAVMAGPAAAVLMVPRTMDWPIGGGIFWMNGSDEQLWPTYLDDTYYSEFGCGDEWRQTMDQRCPSAGFLSLSQHYGMWWSISDAPFEFEVQDSNLRKTVYVVPSGASYLDTWVYTTHAATAIMQDSMRSMHAKSLSYLQATQRHDPGLWGPNPRNLLFAESKRYEVETKAPAVRTTCLSQDGVDLYSGNLTLQFPILQEFESAGIVADLYHNRSGYQLQKIDVFDHVKVHLFNRGLLQTKTSLDEGMFNKTRSILAVPLSVWNHTASSIGIVLMFNGSNIDTGNTSVVACSVDAQWAKAKSILETDGRVQLEHDFERTKVRNLAKTELEVPGFGSVALFPFFPRHDGSMTMIRLEPSWFDLFTPVTPEVPYVVRSHGYGESQTTLEKALEATKWLGNSFELTDTQHLIATFVADGLSRCGMIPNDLPGRFLGAWPRPTNWAVQDEQLAKTMFRHGDPKESFSKPEILAGCNTTRLVMGAYFTGYAISTEGGFDKFCIAVLMTHAVIALCHTLWVVCKSKTSEAWDSIVELVALTARSPLPEDGILGNACAGVKSFKTVGSVAWVETLPVGTDKEQIRFRVKGNTQDRDVTLKPAAGRYYS